MASSGSSGPTIESNRRELLREERLQLGLKQVRAAKPAGISPETLRKYESGGRTPNRATLERVVHALQLSQTQIRAIFTASGFSRDEVQPFVETVPWPAFVVNNLTEVVAANRAAQALWDIDFAAELAQRSRAQINFLSIAAERRFSERIVNWEECFGALISVLKTTPQSAALLEQPGALFGEVLEEYIANDPGAIVRLLTLWAATPPQTAKVRWTYPVVWRTPGIGDVHFLAVVTTASEPVALGFNDWIPLDAETFKRLARVMGGRGAAPGDHRRHSMPVRARPRGGHVVQGTAQL